MPSSAEVVWRQSCALHGNQRTQAFKRKGESNSKRSYTVLCRAVSEAAMWAAPVQVLGKLGGGVTLGLHLLLNWFDIWSESWEREVLFFPGIFPLLLKFKLMWLRDCPGREGFMAQVFYKQSSGRSPAQANSITPSQPLTGPWATWGSPPLASTFTVFWRSCLTPHFVPSHLQGVSIPRWKEDLGAELLCPCY